MWWNKESNSQSVVSTQHLLAALKTNGVELDIEQLLQYQNKASLINLAPRSSFHGHMAGNYLARSKGRGMEFDEVRHYQQGDDIRTIDWRVTARTGKTHTKLFREEIERPVLIATDLSHSMLFGSQLLFKSVQAAHLASIVAWHAKSKGDRVGGIVFNDGLHHELKPRSRQQGVLHYLHSLTTLHQNSLASWQQHKANNPAFFIENCARIRQLARPGSLVYLISDISHLCEDSVRHLMMASRHCELVVCHITDPLEHQLPSVSQKINVAITDGQNREILTLGDKKTSERYQLKAQSVFSEKRAMLDKVGVRLLNFTTDKSIESQLTVRESK